MILTSMVCACLMAGENSPPSGSPATIGAQQQKSFVERFDEALFLDAVHIFLEENAKNGPKIMEVFIKELAGCPIADDAREKMAVSFGSGMEAWLSNLPDKEGEFAVSVLNGDARSEVKAAVLDERYEKLLNSSEMLKFLAGELLNIRKYVGQDLVDLPQKIAVVRFPTAQNGAQALWFLYFRLTKEKKWRWEYGVPIIVPPPPASAGRGLFIYRDYL